jgi:hypothetical protein
MKRLAILVAVTIVAPAPAQEPVKIDKSLFAAPGDDDFKERYAKALAMYAGKPASIEVEDFRVTAHSSRTVFVDLLWPLKRGELTLHAVIKARFKDVKSQSIEKYRGQRVIVTGRATDSNGLFVIEDAKIAPAKSKSKSKSKQRK